MTDHTLFGLPVDPSRTNSKSYWRAFEWRFVQRNPTPERYFTLDAEGNPRSLQRIMIERRVEAATDD